MNFKLDLESMTIATKLKSELTLSGCGWDEGHEWYCRFSAEKLLAEVENCLKNEIKRSQIVIEGIEYDYPIELDGGLGGRSSDIATETPVQAEIEINIARNSILLNMLDRTSES